MSKAQDAIEGLDRFMAYQARKAALQEAVVKIGADEVEAVQRQNSVRDSAGELRQQFDNMMSTIRRDTIERRGEFTESSLTPAQKGEIAAYREQLLAASIARTEAEQAVTNLGEQKNRIQVEIAELKADVTEGALLEHQRRLATLQTEIEDSKVLIGKYQGMAAQVVPEPLKILELESRRADLLAERATGTDNQAAVDDITRAIDTERQRQKEKVPTAAEYTAILSGLGRKLATSQAALTEAEDCRRELLHLYLTSEAERTAEEYLYHVTGLYEKYGELSALASLIGTNGGGRVAERRNDGLNIPCFSLSAFNGKSRFYPPDRTAALAKMTERFTAAGIAL